MAKSIVLTPDSLLVVEKEELVEKIELGPEKISESISLAYKKYPGAEIRTMQLNKLCALTGKSEDEYLALLSDFARKLTELRMKGAVNSDELIVQAVDAIDELNKELNMLSSRIREWYGVIDPMMVNEVQDHQKLVGKISKEIKPSLFGLEPTPIDSKMLSEFASVMSETFKLKEKIESYVEKAMENIAPNVKALAGGILGAKLIAKAGGLKRLAILPGSTIQVLGAERALFRHLIKGTPSPKHGMIFQHPLISGKPKKLRGRIARSLAAKLSIAARLDYYKHGLDKEIIAKFNKRVEEVK